jgi:hypothetical protein
MKARNSAHLDGDMRKIIPRNLAKLPRNRRKQASQVLTAVACFLCPGRTRKDHAGAHPAGGAHNLAPKTGEFPHGSTRRMALATGISEANVRRIWRSYGLKPHRVESVKINTIPNLDEWSVRFRLPSVERYPILPANREPTPCLSAYRCSSTMSCTTCVAVSLSARWRSL